MSGWTCVSCSKQSPEGTRFCGFCGTPAAAAPAIATWSCRMCGTANPEGNAFCGGCGERQQAARTEELRLVTALFADVSGFTTLADTLDVESLHEVITPLVRGLTQIAERYEGFIEKFAGDALLVLYGAPVTHEDDAQRALLAALDMHAELPRLLAEIGPHAANLTIHVGVNTGRVIGRQVGSVQQSDYAVLGDSVILAQRLESACPSGETYVGPTTYELCKDEFEFESVGELTLKGKTKPVEAFRLIGRRGTSEAEAAALVGRDAELAAVEQGLSEAAVTTLVGEPGVGKTRLLSEVRRRADARGTTWLAARCLSYGAALAYWPLADLLRQELGVSPQSPPDEVTTLVATALPPEAVRGALRLLGLTSGGLPEAARREVHDGVLAWLHARAATGPVTLALEDVHWADRSTIEVLAEILRAPDRAISVLLSTRREGIENAASVAGDEPHRVVEVGPLDATGAAGVAAAVLPGPPAPALVELLTTRTKGNALHVSELARSLAESDALVETVAGWDLRTGWDLATIPTTIERVYATRLDALTPSAAALLQLASVIGRTVRLTLLRAVDDTGDIEAPLQQLLDAGMLERAVDSGEAAVTFSHALLQDVVYERLLRKRRRELHRRVADVARSLYGDGDDTIGLLARHLFLADAGEEAVDPLLRAGRHAARLYANDTAAENLQRAVEVLERLEDDRLADALLELAEIQQLRGAYDDALVLYAQVRELRSSAWSAWSGGAAVLRKLGRYTEALALLDKAPAPLATPLLLERARSAFLSGMPGQALGEVRIAISRATDDAERADAMLELVSIECELAYPEFALSHGRRALALLEDRGDARGQAQAHRLLGDAHRRLQQLPDAAAHLQQAVALAEQAGDVEEAAGALVNLARVHADLFDHAQAVEVTLAAAHRFERLGHGSGRAICYGNLSDYVLARGQLDEARDWAEQSLAVSLAIGHRRQAAVAQLTLAEVAVAAGRGEHALDLLREVRGVFVELAMADMVEYCDQVKAAANQTPEDGRGAAPGPTPSAAT